MGSDVAKCLAFAIALTFMLIGSASAAPPPAPGWAWTPAYASNVLVKQDPPFGVTAAKITTADCSPAGAAVTPYPGHFLAFHCSASYVLTSIGANAASHDATVWLRVAPSGLFGSPCASSTSLNAIEESCLEVREAPSVAGTPVAGSSSQSARDWTPWQARAILQQAGWKGTSRFTVEGCSGQGPATAVEGLPTFHFFDCRFLGILAGQTGQSTHLLRLRVTGTSTFVASDLRVYTCRVGPCFG